MKVTGSKKMEDELRVRGEVISSSINAVAIADLKGNLAYANASFLKMWGYASGEVLGKPAAKFWHTEKKALEIIEALRKKGGWIGELTAVKKDGAHFDVQLSASMAKDNSGKPVCMVASFVDISAHKKAGEELLASEVKYRTLLEGLPQKIFLKDRNLVYVSCNRNYARDLKIKSDKISGKTDYDLFAKDLAEKYRTDDKKILASGRKLDIEERYIEKGREILVRTVKEPLKDTDGATIGVLGIFWDVTEEKKIRDEKEKLLHDLGERVKELDCLYGLSLIVEKPGISLERLFQEAVKIIPPAWQYPDITRARIVFENKEVKSPDFRTARWKQEADIIVHGKKAGIIEVIYVEKKLDVNGDPFLKEKRKLIDALAERFGRITEHKRTEEELKKKMRDLERFSKIAVDRELKMKELKARIKELEAKLREK